MQLTWSKLTRIEPKLRGLLDQALAAQSPDGPPDWRWWNEIKRGLNSVVGCWSKITPAAAVGSCLSWITQVMPVVMCGDHERAGRYVARLLFLAARRRWRESGQLVAGLTDKAEAR